LLLRIQIAISADARQSYWMSEEPDRPKREGRRQAQRSYSSGQKLGSHFRYCFHEQENFLHRAIH
jgi:hypothetical protein